jgi:hypothetical protein
VLIRRRSWVRSRRTTARLRTMLSSRGCTCYRQAILGREHVTDRRYCVGIINGPSSVPCASRPFGHRHPCRPDLRVALAAARPPGSLCVRRLEGEVCERLRPDMNQGRGPRSVGSRLICVEFGRSALGHTRASPPTRLGGSSARNRSLTRTTAVGQRGRCHISPVIRAEPCRRCAPVPLTGAKGSLQSLMT